MAREKGPLTFCRQPVHILADFTTEMTNRRRRTFFNNIKQKLQAVCIGYGLLFPARLQVSFNTSRYTFAEPVEAETFYTETIVPTFHSRHAGGTDG